VVIPIILIAGGVWVFQDALASILYYLKKDDENWSYNQPLRIFRAIWGVIFIVCGGLLI